MNWFAELAYPLHPKRGLLGIMITLMDANRAITRDLPRAYLKLPHWRNAARLLLRAADSAAESDIHAATDALLHAVTVEGWMTLEDPVERTLLDFRAERNTT